jgi:hypothetical protein
MIGTKIIVFEDKDGYLRRRLMREDMPDTDAYMGIPADPPDLSQIDWGTVQRELHNLLVKRAIISIDDVEEMKHLSNAILSVLHPKVVGLYKLKKAN